MSEWQGGLPVELKSFGEGINAAVVGTSGGIGGAFVDQLSHCPAISRIARLSRSGPCAASRDGPWLFIDLEDEKSIATAAQEMRALDGGLHLVIVATGMLHDGNRLQPEKTWRSITGPAMEMAFRVNTIGPALVAKHLLPLLATGRKTVFAALSARVGSIDDNRLGGWYAYRASKAALNMVIKSLSIELARRRPQALCVGLHPGTVDTELSAPFQANVPSEKLFSPQRAAWHLLNVLDRLTNEDSGHLYAWDGARLQS